MDVSGQGLPLAPTCLETRGVGVAIWVATRRHDSKTTRILRVRVGKNRGRVVFGLGKIDTKKKRVVFGLDPFFSCQFSCHFSCQFRVKFGSSSCHRSIFVSISGQISCHRSIFVSISGQAGQFRVNFVSRVNFGSCRVKPWRVRVVFVSRFRFVFVSRVVFGSEKKKIDTALTRHEPDTWHELPPLVLGDLSALVYIYFCAINTC